MERNIKEQMCEIGRRLYARGLVASNDGNISARAGDNQFWTTPTGVSKGYMTPDMMIRVNGFGAVLEGTCKPMGVDLFNAFSKMETLEFSAQISLYAKLLGSELELSTEQVRCLLEVRKSLNLPGRHPGLVPRK